MRIRIMISMIEMPILDHGLRINSMSIAYGVKGGAVIQFADPMIGRRRRGQSGGARVMKDAAMMRKPHHIVVDHDACHWRYTGENAFIQRPRQRWQFAFQRIKASLPRRAFRL